MSPETATKDNIQQAMADMRFRSCPSWVVLDRSCGCRQFVVVPCGDLLCVDCQKIWAERLRSRWLPVLESMERPKLLTLTIRSGHDLAERVGVESRSFRRFLDTRLGPRNAPRFLGAAESFLSSHLAKIEADEWTLEQRYQAGVASLERFGRRLVRWREDQAVWGCGLLSLADWFFSYGDLVSCLFLFDRVRKLPLWPRVRDLVGPGFSTREVTYGSEHGWHVHRHCVVDSVYFPWALLVVLWENATKGAGKVADIRAMRGDYKGMLEGVKYVSKVWEIPDDKADELRSALFGLKRIWPLGGAKPEPAESGCPFCKDPECGVDHLAMGNTLWSGQDGQGHPLAFVIVGPNDDQGGVLVRKVNGVWSECSLDLINMAFACHSDRSRDGPDPPKAEHVGSAAQGRQWLN